ncbi:MAG: hypothetical protein ACOYMA_13545 [Bacteroidia bacterium]
MKKHIYLLLFLLVISLNSFANNINKPISSQYGFIENKGQIIDQNNNPNPSVLYLYNGNGLRVQLRKDGFSYEVVNTIKTPKTIADKGLQGKFASQADSFDITYQTHRVDINFKDGNKNTILKPYQPANDFINYYTTGTGEEGVTNVHHFKKIVYENVYPNIDIEFVLNDAANCGKFKYNFIVKPNANLADIKLEFLGANHTSLNQEGNILIETAYGNIEENIPLSYVINNNNSHSTIKANFITLSNNIFGVNVENYNHNQTLVIDPTNWATYYGGIDIDYGYGITKDVSGNILITGGVSSTSSIATIGSYQATCGGNRDAFIAKFNTIGTRVWGTYYGGIGTDFANKISIDFIGNLIITGVTSSLSSIVTTGVHQTTIGGSSDVLLAKFNSSGTRLWGTYFGGTNYEEGLGITSDSIGNIIITGYTNSINSISSIGAHQTGKGAGDDAFVAKFNTSGTRLWSTFYGGNAGDKGRGITSDSFGNIIITGYSISSNSIATIGAHQVILSGNSDAFIAKFNAGGTRLWGTYYGGSGYDAGEDVKTDSIGNIIITGYSGSSTGIATIGAYQTIYAGGYDIIIVKFNAGGTRLWGTYYGGSGYDTGEELMNDSIGNLFITGYSNSSTAIATIGAYQSTFGGGTNDAYIAKFNTSGTRLWGTYFGGSDNDIGTGITIDSIGNIIIIGFTYSTSSIASIGAHQTIQGGLSDVFIAKFAPNGTLPVKLISFNVTLANEKVNCSWETASETNNDYFTIERSKDGNGFESLGNVKGQGNSNINTRYSYTDNNPFGGISYYRLKQTDFDGKYTYSTTKKVGSTEKLTSAIYLYYENNTPIIKINSLFENNAIIELIDLNGTKLLSNEQPVISGENTFAINGNITTGLYLLKVQLENEVKFFKVWVR